MRLELIYMPGVTTIREQTDYHESMSGSEKNKNTLELILMATSWFIWIARNDRAYIQVDRRSC